MYAQQALYLDLDRSSHVLREVDDPEILGPVDFGLREWERCRALCFGGGAFMGSVLPGSNRLVFTGPSPCWQGFFVSSMGGAGAIFENVGVNYVSIAGRASVPSVLVLRRVGQRDLEVEIVPVDAEKLWQGGTGETERGFYSLQRWIWERYAHTFPSLPRVLAVGPGALATDFGAIGSSKPQTSGSPGTPEDWTLSPADGWAGRGGLGSAMVHDHNVYGVIFGGSFIDVDLDDRRFADTWFENRYKVRMLAKDLDATVKYRYDPEIHTGGTLGVNFAKLKDRLFYFNYRSIVWPREKRLAVHERLILGHYLAQFNSETIQTRQFSNCGEPCPAVCKKLRDRFKKDYEPYEALGPNCGIFDQRSAEALVGRCDEVGFDAIQAGGVLSWLLDLLAEGLVRPSDLGVDEVPVFDPENFDPVVDSARNARIAMALVDGIVSRRENLDLSDGARTAAARLGERVGKPGEVSDRLVANLAGDKGWMVPNQYWVAGMFSPMPLMGRYYVHYGDEFLPPDKLGIFNAGRMVQELFLDNLGFCRFHREWVEEVVPDLFRSFWKNDVDLAAHHRSLARRLWANNATVPWESGRVVDLLHRFVRRKLDEAGGPVGGAEAPRPEIEIWLARFDANPRDTALAWWQQVRRSCEATLAREP
jgi:glyceraldehyde-3-phosphate dehydrogenase (ferredoxin)